MAWRAFSSSSSTVPLTRGISTTGTGSATTFSSEGTGCTDTEAFFPPAAVGAAAVDDDEPELMKYQTTAPATTSAATPPTISMSGFLPPESAVCDPPELAESAAADSTVMEELRSKRRSCPCELRELDCDGRRAVASATAPSSTAAVLRL